MLNFILSCLTIVFIHESIHMFFAYIFGFRPKLKVSKFGNIYIQYFNTGNYIKILIVSISPTLILLLSALLLPSSNIWILAKIMGLCNIFNLFPFTTDGEVALYAILNLWKKIKRK